MDMKLKILVLLMMLFVVFSCETEDDGDNHFDFGKESEFEINKEYLSNNQELKFSISAINDSRCPTGAQCIWAGEAKVTIAIESPSVDTLILSTHDKLKDTYRNVEFKLIEVSPYPDIQKDIKQENYLVVLKISQ